MPIVNGIYTKDFPDLGRDLLDTDLIVVAVVGDNVTYKTTVSALLPPVVTGTFDGSGEYDASGDNIREFPVYQVYNSTGYPIPVDYDNANKKLTGGTPSEAFTARFI